MFMRWCWELRSRYGWCSIVAGLGQLRSGAGIWRASSSSSRSSEPAAASSDDGGSGTEAAHAQQLTNFLNRRQANDLQVLTLPSTLPRTCCDRSIYLTAYLQNYPGAPCPCCVVSKRATYDLFVCSNRQCHSCDKHVVDFALPP